MEYLWDEGISLFFSQLFMRIVFSLYYLKYTSTRKQLIIIDSIGSGLIFLITFWPFLENIVKGIFETVLGRLSPVAYFYLKLLIASNIVFNH